MFFFNSVKNFHFPSFRNAKKETSLKSFHLAIFEKYVKASEIFANITLSNWQAAPKATKR